MLRRRFEKLSNNVLVREAAPLLGLYWLYSTIRWFVARDGPYEAVGNAFKIIHLERQLGIFHELTLQRWLIDHAVGLVRIANEFYTIGYLPVLIVCGVLLYRYQPQRFLVFKLSFLLGMGFALVCFSLFPLAPPRMMSVVGFVDTQQVFGANLYNHKSVLSFYNPYAAMPSLHFGWALLMGIMAYGLQHRAFKIMGVLYPSCMAFVIVTTGHHYILDIVVGGIVIGLAYGLVSTLPHVVPVPAFSQVSIRTDLTDRERAHRPRPSRRPTVGDITPWSRQQREDALRRKLESAVMASMTHWRPPG
jgi:hypothetical protein